MSERCRGEYILSAHVVVAETDIGRVDRSDD